MAVPTVVIIGAAAAAAVVVLITGGLLFSRRRKPGSLKSKGVFEGVVDLSDDGVREERERDFMRIAGGPFLHLYTVKKKAPLTLLNLDSSENFAGYKTQLDKYSSALGSYGFALISATTPFEFAIQFQVPPNFRETRYVVITGSESVRVMWAAQMGKFFLCFVSDPLEQGHDNKIRFTYFCQPFRGRRTLASAMTSWLHKHHSFLSTTSSSSSSSR